MEFGICQWAERRYVGYAGRIKLQMPMLQASDSWRASSVMTHGCFQLDETCKVGQLARNVQYRSDRHLYCVLSSEWCLFCTVRCCPVSQHVIDSPGARGQSWQVGARYPQHTSSVCVKLRESAFLCVFHFYARFLVRPFPLGVMWQGWCQGARLPAGPSPIPVRQERDRWEHAGA